MTHVMNNPIGLKNLYSVLGQMITASTQEYGEIHQFIEQAKDSGNLEPENYAQLMSSEFLGSNFQQEYYSAYNEQIPKMQQFLMELEKKLNEYLEIS